MKKISSFFFLFFFFHLAFGQLDSPRLSSQYDSAKQELNSLKHKLANKQDSITQLSKLKNNPITDTLGYASRRLDSLQYSINTKVDSIQSIYASAVARIQQQGQRYKSKIDSLQHLNLPTEKYTARMDSIRQQVTSLEQDVNSKIENVKKKAKAGVDSLDIPPELKNKAAALTKSIDRLGPQSLRDKLPDELKIDKLNLMGKVNPLSRIGASLPGNLNTSAIPSVDLPNSNLPAVSSPADELKNVKGIDEVSAIKDKTSVLTGKTAELEKLGSQYIDQTVESKAGQLKEVKELQKQTGELPIAPLQSEADAKAALKKQAQAVAVDHFAGKERQLKAAMEKMAKYKAKYPSLKGVSELSKKPRNIMRDKPLRERIVPGLALQIQKKGDFLLTDFNPYVGYRFTGRITAGPGWNHRVSYDLDKTRFNTTARIYGPRVFGEFKIGKGFSPRTEVEAMRTVIPPALHHPLPDPSSNEWVWGVFVGMKKEYKIYKNIKGTAVVMARLFDRDRKSPYADVVNARIGFELGMNKKKKKKAGSGA